VIPVDEHAMIENQALKEHIQSHVMYPATKAQLLQSCMVGEFPDDVHKMAEMHLQDKTYTSAAEVLRDLHMA
jgi:hypothetical protein